MSIRFSEVERHVDEITHTYYSYNHLITVAREGVALGELYYPTDIAVDSNINQIYVTQGLCDTSRVSIFSDTGYFLEAFSHECMWSPRDIAVHMGNIYVTNTDHFILHFKVAADIYLADKVKCFGSGIGKFNDPNKIAVSNYGDVFVTDFNNDRIRILDSYLYYKRQISHHSMKKPCDIKIASNQVYALSYSDSPCLHIFSYYGEKKRSLITSGMGLQVTRPQFFCVDSNENIFLSDLDGDHIKIFSKEGTYLRSLCELYDEKPSRIALANNLKLVTVSKSVKSILQIYSY